MLDWGPAFRIVAILLFVMSSCIAPQKRPEDPKQRTLHHLFHMIISEELWWAMACLGMHESEFGFFVELYEVFRYCCRRAWWVVRNSTGAFIIFGMATMHRTGHSVFDFGVPGPGGLGPPAEPGGAWPRGGDGGIYFRSPYCFHSFEIHVDAFYDFDPH